MSAGAGSPDRLQFQQIDCHVKCSSSQTGALDHSDGSKSSSTVENMRARTAAATASSSTGKVARDGEMLQARTRDFKTVIVPSSAGAIGSYLDVTLTGTTGATFTGTLVASAAPSRALLPMAG